MNGAALQVDSPVVFHVEIHDRAEFDRIPLPVWDYRRCVVAMPLLVKELTDGSTAVLFKYLLTPEDLAEPRQLAGLCNVMEGPLQ